MYAYTNRYIYPYTKMYFCMIDTISDSRNKAVLDGLYIIYLSPRAQEPVSGSAPQVGNVYIYSICAYKLQYDSCAVLISKKRTLRGKSSCHASPLSCPKAY